MSVAPVVRARGVWTPGGWLEDGAVVLDGDHRTIREVRPARAGDGPKQEGLLIPGLVNAHTHLELGNLEGRLPRGGVGFKAWGAALMEARRSDTAETDRSTTLERGARSLRRYGVALVSDITNQGGVEGALQAAQVRGVVQHELMGFSPSSEVLERARDEGRLSGGVVTRPTAHAPYSTNPEIIRRTAGARHGAPASVHLAEDEAERVFLMRGEGMYADWLDELGVSWRHVDVPGCDSVSYLEQLGALGPGQLIVHGVDLTPSEQRALAASGAALCLCPRSNLWIGGKLPDVPGLIEAGVPLCLGTDSLASCDSLDVLEEIPVLAEAFPDVPTDFWLDLATRGGARALGVPWGRIQPGCAPGLVLLAGVGELTSLRGSAPTERRWCADPGPCPWSSGGVA